VVPFVVRCVTCVVNGVCTALWFLFVVRCGCVCEHTPNGGRDPFRTSLFRFFALSSRDYSLEGALWLRVWCVVVTCVVRCGYVCSVLCYVCCALLRVWCIVLCMWCAVCCRYVCSVLWIRMCVAVWYVCDVLCSALWLRVYFVAVTLRFVRRSSPKADTRGE